MLVWTTTPWTLPGNVAVAVNPEIIYAVVKVGDERFILAKERLKDCKIQGEVIEEFKGKQLIGLEYIPLYPQSNRGPTSVSQTEAQPLSTYKVIGGDFVSLKEGTGLVHIAPAFGEDDMELIRIKNQELRIKNEPEFPILLTVDEEGKFKPEVKKWAGMFVKYADPLIIEDLKNRGLLYKEELYEHDYPFCWRCDTPLLYYAKDSWFIKVSAVKNVLIKNNQKINWIPSHIKEGRFGEWLKEAKDWAISRERYWGTPLPVWRCQTGKSQIPNPKFFTRPNFAEGKNYGGQANSKSQIPNPKQCNQLEIIGSLQDLLKQKFSTNNYFLFRHGHSLRQVKNVASCWPEKVPMPLTRQGRGEVSGSARKLKREKIDIIFSSDLLRTRQTAELISRETGAKIIFSKQLRELNVGILNNKDPKLFWTYVSKKKNPYFEKTPKGECLNDVRKRMYRFLEKTAQRYRGKNIVIVSHEYPLTILEKTLEGLSLEEIQDWRRKNRDKLIKTGGWRKIEFKKLPFNEKMELDFHRPYIDEVKFYCQKCSCLMERVPEVMDCWFDSGAMPFAQGHWPFAPAFAKATAGKQNSKLKPPELFPADFIAEGIDQTRGWFYTLLTVSTLLGFGTPYKNVISLGLVLDAKGQKMSKSKGNVVFPKDVVDKFGADTARFYFYTLNPESEPKRFDFKDVATLYRKFFDTLFNALNFFSTYGDKKLGLMNKKSKAKNVLDRWIISRFQNLNLLLVESLENYDVVSAARLFLDFTDDLSNWYIRRSRRRFQKPHGEEERNKASQTLHYILLGLAKLLAPFTPFTAEFFYRRLDGEKGSVHFEDYPKPVAGLIDQKLEKDMAKAREIVVLALAKRAELGIKVRQPLKELRIGNYELKDEKGLLDLLREEVNVKNIVFDATIKEGVWLDTEITPELKEEGLVRELVRNIQEMRKEIGLKPRHKILIGYFGEKEIEGILERNKKIILEETRAKDLIRLEEFLGGLDFKKQIKVGQEKLSLGIKRLI